MTVLSMKNLILDWTMNLFISFHFYLIMKFLIIFNDFQIKN